MGLQQLLFNNANRQKIIGENLKASSIKNIFQSQSIKIERMEIFETISPKHIYELKKIKNNCFYFL